MNQSRERTPHRKCIYVLHMPLECVKPTTRESEKCVSIQTYERVNVCIHTKHVTDHEKVHYLLYIPIKCVRPTTRQREGYI